MKKEKYRLKKIVFNSKARRFLNKSYVYSLKLGKGEFILFGNLNEVSEGFRRALKHLYPSRVVADVPKGDFFKDYLTKRFNKQTRITAKIAEKKKPYYIKRKIEVNKRLIKRLEKEIIEIKEELGIK